MASLLASICQILNDVIHNIFKFNTISERNEQEEEFSTVKFHLSIK